MTILLLLLLLAIFVSLYDLRHARIPNWVTLPLILLGSFANLPKTWYVLVFLAGFFFAWQVGWMGGGDAKFWAGIILFLPATEIVLWVLPLTFFSAALLQFLWRKLRGDIVFGRRTPAAWRTVVYLIILVGIHAY